MRKVLQLFPPRSSRSGPLGESGSLQTLRQRPPSPMSLPRCRSRYFPTTTMTFLRLRSQQRALPRHSLRAPLLPESTASTSPMTMIPSPHRPQHTVHHRPDGHPSPQPCQSPLPKASSDNNKNRRTSMTGKQPKPTLPQAQEPQQPPCQRNQPPPPPPQPQPSSTSRAQASTGSATSAKSKSAATRPTRCSLPTMRRQPRASKKGRTRDRAGGHGD